MSDFIHARLQPGVDDDLIAWLAAQPDGRRSEAIRSLLRDGLRMRQMEGNLTKLIRQGIEEALADVQLTSIQPDTPPMTNEVEDVFGDKFDQMFSGFDG